MILGWAKNLNVPPEYVLYEMSHDNLLLYSKATPSYYDEKDEWDDTLDANNPDNFKFKEEKDTSERIYVT